MKNEIKNVALYIRVSTDRQAKEGDSLEAQENALVKYCNEHNYIIIDKYIDGGESGQKLKRTNLQRLLYDVENGEIELVLMTKLDRWFRNIADFYKVIEILKRNNVNWKTIWEDYDTTTASGEFWLNMSLSMGQLEAKRTSERINEIFNYKYHNQKTVCTGRAPYGYKISTEKKYIVDEKESQNIIKLFEHYAKTNNLNETCKWFNENCDNKSITVIKKYLRNPIYIGQFNIKRTGEFLDDYIPRIISDDLWNEVNTLIQMNIKRSVSNPNSKRHNTKAYIFNQLLICGECGHILSGKCNSNSRHYYNCRYSYFKKCNNNKCINEDKLEQYLLKEIIPILNQRKIDIMNINSNKEKVVDNSKKIKDKLNKLADLYLNNMIDLDYYKEQYNNLINELNLIQTNKKENTKLDYSYIDKFLKNDLLKIYETLSNEEKRRLWRSIIKSIEIKGYDDIKVNVY